MPRSNRAGCGFDIVPHMDASFAQPDSVELRAIQVRRELLLRERLEGDSGVRRALDRLKDRSSGFGFVGRRRLLSNALRLTRRMAPDIARALSACRLRIGFDHPVEVFVRPEPVFSAFCTKDAAGPVIIGLSSRLLECFTPAELQFVIGHELGHAAFDHLAIPMPHTARMEDMAGRIVSRRSALDLYLWCRSAELTADRVGLICTEDPEAAGSAFFKLASGVSSDRIRPDLESFGAQIESLATAPEARLKPRSDDDSLDCFSTHPYSPVRVRALLAFSRSQQYRRAIGDDDASGLGDAELDAIINRDLDLMWPSYLEEKTATSSLLRHVLYNGGVLVAAANQAISEHEAASLRALLGAECDGLADASDAVDLDRTLRELNEQVQQVLRVVKAPERVRLLQHLTIIAAADGEADDREREILGRIASQLGVNPAIIDQTLDAAAQPLD